MITPARLFIVKEVRTAIRELNPKKTSGNDLTTNQSSVEKGIKFIIQFCKASVRFQTRILSTSVEGSANHYNPEAIRQNMPNRTTNTTILAAHNNHVKVYLRL